MRRRTGIVVALVAVLVAAVSAGCTGDADDRVVPIVTSPTTVADQQAPDAVMAAVLARLSSVDTANLELGREFNRQFLTLQFQAIGLTETESNCAAGEVEAAGADFATRPVSQIVSRAGITPDVLLPCVRTERMLALGAQGVSPDLSKAPPERVRATFTELASAGYESVGLTPVEAACVAEAVVGAYADDELAGPLTALAVDTAGTQAALPGCVTEDRMIELGR